MVELKVRIGPKGQIVIPKILRDSYNLFPNQEAIVKEEEEGVLITKSNEDPIKVLEKIAEIATKRRKGKKFVFDSDKSYEEQLEKRARRAGL